MLVAWLERFEDHAQFPIDELLMEFDVSRSQSARSLLERETVVIFIHHLTSGLYRIHIRSTIRYVTHLTDLSTGKDIDGVDLAEEVGRESGSTGGEARDIIRNMGLFRTSLLQQET